MTPAEIRTCLASENIRLTRSLGQNFLHDANQLRRIVELADVRPGDRILEIGPGLGPLTGRLLAAGAMVLAVEKDARLVPVLRRRLPDATRLEIVEADALVWLRTENGLPDLSAWKVVSNLPYSVGSPILVELAQLPRPPGCVIVTLQAEVVQRIRAVPGTRDYGVLTLLLARAFQAGRSFRIPAGCFFPAPDVESACVRLDARHPPLVEDRLGAAYARLVKTAFSQRRKRLHKVLSPAYPAPALHRAWKDLGLHPDVRAEAVSPAQFAQLTVRLTVAGAPANGSDDASPTLDSRPAPAEHPPR